MFFVFFSYPDAKIVVILSFANFFQFFVFMVI